MRKSGLTGDEAYALSKRRKTTEDLGPLKKEIGLLKEDLSNKITKFYASNQGEAHLADSDNGKIQDMMLYGRSEQKQYTGKNLLELSDNQVQNGNLKFQISQGIITFSGSSDNTAFVEKIKDFIVPSDGTYTISTNSDSNNESPRILISINGGSFESALNGTTKELTTDDVASLYIRITTIGSYNGRTIKPMIEKGSKVTSYEPYTGGIPSPSPDYPQEIKSVVNPTVKVSNEDGTQFKTVTLPYTLNAIPVSSGGNVTINGQQYAADYVDVERGKLAKMVDSSKLDNAQSIVNKTEWLLAEPQEIDLTQEEVQTLKALATYYPTTNISVNSEQLDGYTVFNYPVSMQNGWNYVKQQLNDNRDYIYDMDTKTQDIDTQAAEAYVNSEYAVALTELEV